MIIFVLTGMDAQVSYAFHSERKLHPEKFKNQINNQVIIFFNLIPVQKTCCQSFGFSFIFSIHFANGVNPEYCIHTLCIYNTS